MEDKWFYRYESKRYSVVIDADIDLYGVSDPRLELYKWKVHSETPKGTWIGIFGGKDKWISKTARKRFACPTEREALEQYILRKQAYVRHAEENLRKARSDLSLGIAMVRKNETNNVCA